MSVHKYSWAKETKKDFILKYLLFFFFPLLSALYALRRLNTKSSFVVLFMFGILLGGAFSVHTFESTKTTLDSAWYRYIFENYKFITYSEYLVDVKRFLTGDLKDFFFQTIAFGISRFTDNYHYLFFVVAIFFSFFSLCSVRFLIREPEFKFTVSSLILLYLFLKISIIEINGIRYWTAYWLAIYCTFKIFVDKNKAFYLLALATPFFHGTFWIFIFLLLVVESTRRFERIWIVLFLISFFVSSFAVELLLIVQQYLPSGLSRSIDSYTSAEIIASRKSWSGWGWIPKYFNLFVKIYINTLIVLFIKNASYIKEEIRSKDLYILILIWATVFNFFSAIPSLGSRNFYLLYPVVSYVWLVSFADKKYKTILYCALIVFSWDFIFDFVARLLLHINPKVFVTNPLITLYNYLG